MTQTDLYNYLSMRGAGGLVGWCPRKEAMEELHAVAMTELYNRRTHLKKDRLSDTPACVNSAGPSVGRVSIQNPEKRQHTFISKAACYLREGNANRMRQNSARM